jgi:hypothetical protein
MAGIALAVMVGIGTAGCGGGGGGGTSGPSFYASGPTGTDSGTTGGTTGGTSVGTSSGTTSGGSGTSGTSTTGGGVAGIARLTVTLPATRLPVLSYGALSLAAVGAAGQAVTPTTGQIQWTSTSGTIAHVEADAGGLRVITGPRGDATLTATDTVSGTRASATVHVGYPLRLTLDTAGTTLPVRIAVTPAADGLDAFDQQTIDAQGGFERIAGGGQKTAVNFNTDLAGASVLENGAPVTLSAPATWGDLGFAGWTKNGQAASSAAALTLDPKTLPLDGSPTFALAARYVVRAPGGDGYGPNYLDASDPNSGLPNAQFIFPDVPHLKVAFVAAADFTADRKQQAEAGIQWWTQATGGKVTFEFLPDGDTADANVIVCFTSNANDPTVHPGNWIPRLAGQTFQALPGGGRTFFDTYFPTADPRIMLAIGKRVIHIYSDPPVILPGDVTATAAHEMFHAVGMSGHSTDKGDVMYPVEMAWRFASARDVNSLVTLLQHAAARNAGRSRAVPAGPPHPAAPIR